MPPSILLTVEESASREILSALIAGKPKSELSYVALDLLLGLNDGRFRCERRPDGLLKNFRVDEPRPSHGLGADLSKERSAP